MNIFNRHNTKKKLTTMISLILAFLLVTAFIIQGILTMYFSKRTVEQATNGEFSGISRQNMMIAQTIIGNTAVITQQIAKNIVESYSQMADSPESLLPQGGDESSHSIEIETSDVAGQFADIAETIAENYPDIQSIKICFESIELNEANDGDSEYFNEDYYEIPMRTELPYITDPYELDGDMIISISYPLIHGDEVIGVVVSNVNSLSFSRMITKDERYSTMFTNVITDDSVIIYTSTVDGVIGSNLSDYTSDEDMKVLSENFENGEAFTVFTERASSGRTAIVSRFYTPLVVYDEIWWTQTGVELSELNENFSALGRLMLLITSVSLFSIIIITYMIIKRKLRPIKPIENIAKELSAGNFQIDFTHTSNDELGSLSDSMRTLIMTTKTVIKDMSDILTNLAQGDFTIELTDSAFYVGEYQPLAASMCQIIEQLSAVINEIQEVASQVTMGSEQIAISSQLLAQGAIVQAGSIEQVSATFSELSMQVGKTSENAQNAKTGVGRVKREIEFGSEKMQEMMFAMKDINLQSAEIEQIIKTIEEISFQTNILSLNASVEAARAGAAGKGFAVVADEVRNLAQKSAAAAKDTTVRIKDAATAVSRGIEIAKETELSINEVVQSAQEVTGFVDIIAKASEEQARHIEEVATEVRQISSIVQTNSSTAEECAAGSQQLSAQANSLKGLISNFKTRESENASQNQSNNKATEHKPKTLKSKY